MFGTALVTGANRGLGFEFVRALLTRAGTVFAGYRSPDTSKQLFALAEKQTSVVPVRLDVQDDSTIAKARDEISSRTESLDLLINNAAILLNSESGFDQLTRESLNRHLDVNVSGPHLVVNEFLPLLRKSEIARVANISSDMGSITGASTSSPAYRISKAALNMLTRIQAHGLRGDKIVIVSINPGWLRTDMGGKSAALDPAESAKQILDLIERMSLRDSGRFMDRRGKDIPF